MAVEIERKFLVESDGWREAVLQSRTIVDYPIAHFDTGKARVRFCEGGATLTLKGQRRGFTRSEFHLDLEVDKASAMVAEFATRPPLEKHRHEVDVAGLTWQVDEFLGALSGLVTADVELPSEHHSLARPAWIGREITGDPKFSTIRLVTLTEGSDDLVQTLLSA